MEWSALKNDPATWWWLTRERRTGIYIIEARDQAHYTTRTYKRDLELYAKGKTDKWKDGTPPPEPPVGKRIYKVGAAGNMGGTLGRRLSQYATLNFPNGFLVHYIGISGKSDPTFTPHGGHSNTSQVQRVERKILDTLKTRGTLYRSLGAKEWTFEPLDSLIQIARVAHGGNAGRQFHAVRGTLVDDKNTPITSVARYAWTITDVAADTDLPPPTKPFIDRSHLTRSAGMPSRFLE
jgi:hypothetical protein